MVATFILGVNIQLRAVKVSYELSIDTEFVGEHTKAKSIITKELSKKSLVWL